MITIIDDIIKIIIGERASEASETLSGLFNRESWIYILLYIVRANFVLITRKEGGA